MLRTTILKLLLVVAALLFFVDKAAACTCEGPRQDPGFHPCMVYSSTDAVFIGRVEEVSTTAQDEGGRPLFFHNKVVHFSVDKAFRGVEGSTVEIMTNSNTASCGYDFKQGQQYFVYAKRDENGKLEVRLCSPTVPLERAAEDLKYTKEVMDGIKDARIVGAVIKRERRDSRDYGLPSPVPGVEVVLQRYDDTAGERLVKTVTNGEGRYEFRGLGAGGYHIRATLPAGLREWSRDGKPKEHYTWPRVDKCTSDSFFLTNSGSMRGRVITPEGSPPPPPNVGLIPLDDQGNELSSAFTPGATSFGKNGSYYFPDVPPGRYLLAFNPRNKPGKSDPVYPLTYYPGVMSKGQATVILVSNSREISVNDFMLTRPVKERWFSGMVLLADRTPAVGAKVILIDPNDRMMETNVMEVITDEQGRFRVRGYESFPYWIDAYVDASTQSRGGPWFAPPVQLATSGSVEGIELVISLTYRSQPYHEFHRKN